MLISYQYLKRKTAFQGAERAYVMKVIINNYISTAFLALLIDFYKNKIKQIRTYATKTKTVVFRTLILYQFFTKNINFLYLSCLSFI